LSENSRVSKRTISVHRPCWKEYRISAEQKGYIFNSEVFEVPELTTYRQLEKNIELIPIPPVISVPPKTQLTVLFDFDKADLRPNQNLSWIVRSASFFKIQDAGLKFQRTRTNSGTEEYNLDLSERRAATVRTYLVKHGVPMTSSFRRDMEHHSRSDTNDTPQGRQRNRRVELTVIE